MVSEARIEKGLWWDVSWNVTTGCTPDFQCWQRCWARRMAGRMAANPNIKHRERYEGFKPSIWPERLDEPLQLRKPRVIAVSLMGDLWHDLIPVDFIWKVWQMMRDTPHHTYVMLTKRSGRMRRVLSHGHSVVTDENWGILPNVIGMVTVENQEMADRRIPDLLATPFAVRGVSMEPMLESVYLFVRNCKASSTCPMWVEGLGCGGCATSLDLGIDWVIVGGESGPGARPMKPQWARDLRDQCQAAGTPYFHKQNGEWIPLEMYDGQFLGNLQREWFDGCRMVRVGKKAAGRLLDGGEWNEVPEAKNATL